MNPKDLTDVQMATINAKIVELIKTISDTMGCTVDLLTLVHQHHTGDEQCQGVFIMDSGLIPLPNAYSMLMQGVVLAEGAMVQQILETTPPPGTTLQ